jgi:hypothetical protein
MYIETYSYADVNIHVCYHVDIYLGWKLLSRCINQHGHPQLRIVSLLGGCLIFSCYKTEFRLIRRVLWILLRRRWPPLEVGTLDSFCCFSWLKYDRIVIIASLQQAAEAAQRRNFGEACCPVHPSRPFHSQTSSSGQLFEEVWWWIKNKMISSLKTHPTNNKDWRK